MPADGSNIVPLLSMPAHLATVEVYEALREDPRISEPFRQAIKRKLNRYYQEQREAQDRQGVRWSGMETDPYRLPPVEVTLAEAEAELARRNSPRARFFAALSAAEEVDPVRADQVRKEFNRSAGEDAESIEPACAGACIALLNQIAGRGARDCLDAIAELLMRRAA